ncbi:adenosine deaminase [Vibrio sp. UCD-FRSSP16_10]|uniref:adenosine deaminase n=1 Tax=unclassified Vibrio TaxID=2614977 RepID=UPI0007FEFB27|nr:MULTISPECIES: adenosine deaminase [unclassified Vibrio]OBT07941.1 adenosine deaminase [Vibrio sp. UCD-FRSSP16_30]OBT17116.1 adenosine deaminase [Vibrio sp. UCD-FRSSP16_10]
MDFHSLPKIDLHCHLDGSVRPETLIELAKIQQIEIPSQDVDVIRDMMIAPETCVDLKQYLTRFDLPLLVMQTEQALEQISYQVFEDAAKENVKYLEVRFAPLLHVNKGLSVEKIIAAVVKGMKRAELDYDIHGNFVLCILRTMPKDDIKLVIDEGAKFLGHGVEAFDLAGAELTGFCHDFVEEAKYARKKGFHITIHAGEQGDGQNVQDAIELLKAERIGHGIHIIDHSGGFKAVRNGNVGLETCPSSNVQTKAVENIESHPAKRFYKQGLAVTINTDNRTVSNTTMTKEVQKVCELFYLSPKDYQAIYLTSIEQSFANEEVKAQLRAYID